MELPGEGLILVQSSTEAVRPEARLEYLKSSARKRATPGFVMGGVSLAAGVASLAFGIGSPTVGLALSGAGMLLGGGTALYMSNEIKRAEMSLGPDDYTVVENRIQEKIVPANCGDGFLSVPSGGQSNNYYEVSTDPTSDDILVFKEIPAGHHAYLAGPTYVPPITDVMDDGIAITGWDGTKEILRTRH